MHTTSLALLVAALPLGLAAPQHNKRQGDFEGCEVRYVPVDPVLKGSDSSGDDVIGFKTVTSTTPTFTDSPGEAVVDEQVNDVANDDVKASFAASTTWDFGSLSALPTGASQLRISYDTITEDAAPLTHTFSDANVKVEGGYLVLTVPGGQEGSPDVSSAEVYTDFDVLYASVRTYAILTEEPGVCNGMFLFQYEAPEQETDIEWISDPAAQQNDLANNGTRALIYTNYNPDGEGKVSLYGAAPDDATSKVHEYRLDWLEDRTEWFRDGVSQYNQTQYVSNRAGPWVWNNWGNGDPGWTGNVPREDAEFRIQKIEMYYNPA